jgi:predicted metal-dependent hydrolase
MSVESDPLEGLANADVRGPATQLSLPLSESDLGDEGVVELPPVSAAQIDSMHRLLASHLGEPLDLVGTNNRRTLLSWRRGINGLLQLRIHRQFSRAEEPTLHAVAEYILTGDSHSAGEITNFARELGLIGRPSGRPRFGAPLGLAHDLRSYLDEQNREHFDGQFKGRIGWSRRNRQRHRRTIRLGSWSPRNRLIRIHPALDDKHVPDYVLRFVVFHEMLHAIVGANAQGTRTVYHTRDFRRREQEHPDHDRAEKWIADNLEALLSW